MVKVEKYMSLLECWIPPDIETESNSVPISFVSTSFTFDPEFFEEECLSRFLNMETEKENDGVAYLVEREEKLGALKGGIVIIDQHNCKGDRTLRWDLVSCRLKKGILHAKITVLHWSDCIRIIIGSANLTQLGHCVNQEVFGVFEYSAEEDNDLGILEKVLDYIESILKDQNSYQAAGKFEQIKKAILLQASQWGITKKKYRPDEVGCEVLLTKPGNPSLIEQLSQTWDSNFYSPADTAFIISPFFDTSETSNSPSVRIFDTLRKRGEVWIQYYTSGEQRSETSDLLQLHAPEFLSHPPRPDVQKTFFHLVPGLGKNENDRQVPRPLHLKYVCLTNYNEFLYLIGSSNFTSAGFGTVNRINYEANIVYTVNKSRNRRDWVDIDQCFPDKVDLNPGDFKFTPIQNEDEAIEDPDFLSLPDFFNEAVIKKQDERIILVLTFTEISISPEGYKIFEPLKSDLSKSGDMILDHKTWLKYENKAVIEIEWTND